MKNNRSTWSAVHLVFVAALTASVAGCGGGGDGQPPPTLEITPTNSDRVGHFTAAGIFALLTPLRSPGMLSLAGDKAQPAAWSGRPFALLQFHTQRMTAGDGRKGPLAAFSTGDLPCNFGGTLSLTRDDLDNSGAGPTTGDVDTLVYKNCVGTVSETLNGTVTVTYTQIGDTSASYRVALAQFSDVTTNHSLTVNGSYLLEESSAAASMVTDTTMTANGQVVVSVTTHLPFTDTVTLYDGFVLQERYDASVLPPPGNPNPARGQSSSTLTGRLESASAGGTVDVSSAASAPIIKHRAEAYPRSGTVQVKGKKGTLMLTALSADSVRLDLDANDDGSIESTTAATWDWLL